MRRFILASALLPPVYICCSLQDRRRYVPACNPKCRIRSSQYLSTMKDRRLYELSTRIQVLAVNKYKTSPW
ncbi:hypothetical protein K461DRAFT_279256 [Myriangium duriaei CBS 260.36]|uniref:Secreted protein n=1 Tax=Myriangium duriaei CBS 260.36 TaxID=1168546 RepID=A0A9P4J1J8_9PEZI|nr:hypothetical protein K461DRAFT_279256 [Myriangium duriaei CBS 260.36]